MLFTHSHIQPYSYTRMYVSHMQCGTHSSLRLTLGSAAVSHGPRPSQAQSRSQSQTQSAITNRILLVARRKRLTTRKCLTVCVYNGHNVLHTQRERERESGRAEEWESGRVGERQCKRVSERPGGWCHHNGLMMCYII